MNTPDLKKTREVYLPAVNEPGMSDDAPESWLDRHKNKLLATAYVGAAALTLTELGPIKDDLEASVRWTVPAIFATESVATAGLAAMVASTGNKIGNPLTLRNRLKELRTKLTASPTYRTGAYLNLTGAIGTSGIIAAETVKNLPVNAWPLSLGVAGMSTALSIPFYKIARHKEDNGEAR